ncbi:MAG: OmpA family protein [Muribaculaceae bacterium]|nr:OmpA family protein [Muribaculaceae bacterium]
MKKHFILPVAAVGAFFAANSANAQETVVVEEDVTVSEVVPCKTHYYTDKHDNWFLQLGAGVNSPFMENNMDGLSGPHHQLTAAYNIGFGRWFSPYLAWRLDLQYSQMKWKNDGLDKARYANANFDIMWDMFNTFHGVNPNRVFSLVPFAGLGGTFAWDFDATGSNNYNNHGEIKHNSWTLPVSAGLQLRFRLCRYADFFLEGRAQFYGDNFNLCTGGRPIDINITALAGLNINFGGRNYKSYNACNDLAYISRLNQQVNDLRGELATTAAALAVAESQLPCPEVETVTQTTVVETAPMLSSVRFKINSDVISSEEMVNVFNVAEYMKANPAVNVLIQGYADKDTGTATYNKDLSLRRAQAVYNALTKTYGVDANRLAVEGEGSSVQPYSTNNWNRIVIFSPVVD